MLKYIIFGAGRIGEVALYYLGYERVLCFIDNYKFGTELYGKRILSFHEMLEMDMNGCIIAIASVNYAKDIEQQLVGENVLNYFIFKEDVQWEINEFLPFYKIYRKREFKTFTWLLAKYTMRNYKNIIILGNNKFIHYLIMEIGVQSDMSNIIGIIDLSDESKKGNIWGIPFVSLDGVINTADCVIVNVRRHENKYLDYIESKQQDYDIIDIYDAERYEITFRHAELEKFHNVHKNKRIWLIGNGPSLKIEDLETLSNNEEICFGFNRIYKAYDKTKWRAHYLGISDYRMIEDCMEIVGKSDCVIFVGDEYHRNTDIYLDKVQYFHLISEEYYPNMPRFSENIVNGTFWGYTVIFDIGLQFASYMGAKEIYLLGVDNSHIGNITDSCNHFIQNYFSEEEKIKYKNDIGAWEKINKAYEAAEKYSRQNGFRIYNATRGGALEVFERVDFESLFL